MTSTIEKLCDKCELIELAHSAWSMALCAMNGMPIPVEWGEAVEHGLRKYGIDVDNEIESFEISNDFEES